jgi:hypothetical protein
MPRLCEADFQTAMRRADLLEPARGARGDIVPDHEHWLEEARAALQRLVDLGARPSAALEEFDWNAGARRLRARQNSARNLHERARQRDERPLARELGPPSPELRTSAAYAGDSEPQAAVPDGEYVCPCCESDVDVLVTLRARGERAGTQLVCDSCWYDAIHRQDRSVWAWYWSAPPVDDD